MTERRRVYLDHSATTPMDDRAVSAMLPYFFEVYGNPSSSHHFGRQAEMATESARESISRVLNCSPEEIVFTSGGSESDNLALRGAALSPRKTGKHLVTSPLEHEAIGKTVDQLVETLGYTASRLRVDTYGSIQPDDLSGACQPETRIVSVMYANNEVGTIQPLAQLSAITRVKDVLFHTDAVQAGGQLTLDVQALGVDLLSLSAHKFYGPKGVGVLYIRKGIDLLPSQTGGSHESNRRAGTHNTPGIVGMARALELAYEEFDHWTAQYRSRRDQLIEGVLSHVDGARLTGHPDQRLPSHASFVIEGVESNTLLMHLDMKGVAASSGSACKTGNPEPSGVLLALGYSEDEALGSLRLTVGRQTTEADIDYTVMVLVEAVEKVRRLRQVRVS